MKKHNQRQPPPPKKTNSFIVYTYARQADINHIILMRCHAKPNADCRTESAPIEKLPEISELQTVYGRVEPVSYDAGNETKKKDTCHVSCDCLVGVNTCSVKLFLKDNHSIVLWLYDQTLPVLVNVWYPFSHLKKVWHTWKTATQSVDDCQIVDFGEGHALRLAFVFWKIGHFKDDRCCRCDCDGWCEKTAHSFTFLGKVFVVHPSAFEWSRKASKRILNHFGMTCQLINCTV